MVKRGKRRASPRRKATRRAGQPKRAARPRKSPKRQLGRSQRARTRARAARTPRKAAQKVKKVPRLEHPRRTLAEDVLTPPSSLDLNRRASAARTGRAELENRLHEHTGMTPAITGGDVDADWENAYFSGDEAPGGDNPTPDQEIVDDIGKSLGVQYADAEELKSGEKLTERDKHRWELDPASSEDYKDRK